MKLFVKLFGIPDTRKPDYDFIRNAEAEFNLGDDGFDKRYDEMLLTEFKKRWAAEQWDDEKLEDELYKLGDNVVMEETMLEVDNMIRDLKAELRIAKGLDFKRSCDNLRSIMMLNSRQRNR